MFVLYFYSERSNIWTRYELMINAVFKCYFFLKDLAAAHLSSSICLSRDRSTASSKLNSPKSAILSLFPDDIVKDNNIPGEEWLLWWLLLFLHYVCMLLNISSPGTLLYGIR
jgi:hypothetical protein